jgi:hypothetical protein
MAGERSKETGKPWAKSSGLYSCELYTAGHTVHWIQANRSTGEPHRDGTLIAVEGNSITIDFGDEIKIYRNHDVERLVGIVGIGGPVKVCEDFVILRSPSVAGHYCFSIQDGRKGWTPCDHEPLTAATPEALAERAMTHGGFFVPGTEVLRALDVTDG